MSGRRGRPRFIAIYAAAVLSVAYLGLLNVLPSATPAPEVRTAMTAAAALMARSEAALKACREARGIPIDAAVDPNGTGL
ncbi:MAG: hypothetical protein NTX99_04045, partial [Candidatus Aminicenantes bacterium]|nr:hypothetical protein [Candidatus Aminicenantes bacterium]